VLSSLTNVVKEHSWPVRHRLNAVTLIDETHGSRFALRYAEETSIILFDAHDRDQL